jgi:L,D-transpeptidase YcbB
MNMRFLLSALLLLSQPLAAQSPAAQTLSPQLPPAVLEPPQPPRPEWTAATATDLLDAVRASAAEGLSPRDHGETALADALLSADPAAIAGAATGSYLSLARAYLQGQTPGTARREWHLAAPRADPSLLQVSMEQAIRSGTVRQSLDAMLPTHPHYTALKESLVDTKDPGMRATLRANMDRWRWMPRKLGETHILVNVPTFELALVRNGETIATHMIIVGARKTPTPQFSTVATGVILNPPWVVPQSIIRESVGSLVRNRPATARARGYTWTSGGGTLSVTQSPGPGNSLGQMKIDMPNSYAIFLHDTPAKAPVRQEGSRLFARLHPYPPGAGAGRNCCLPTSPAGMPRGSPRFSKRARRPGLLLPQQIPVHVVYFTALPGPRRQGADPSRTSTGGTPPSSRPYRRTLPQIRPRWQRSGCHAEMPNRPA